MSRTVQPEEEIRYWRDEALRLRSALEEIAKVGYGLELTDSDEYRAEYWSKTALRFQTLARTALKKGGRDG